MWHLWQRYKQKSPFQESTQAPQLCFWYTVRVIGRERHEQNFNELSVFGKLNLIMSSNLVKWPQDWQGQTRSHGSRSKLLVDIQPGHEVVSTQIRDAVGSQPFASEDSTPWKAPRTFDCIFKQSASIMKMTGHLDDGFYHALRYQQSRHFNTCQGSKLRRTMSHLLRQAIVILLHPVMQQPASPQLHKKPGDVAVGWNLPVVEARLVLCRTDSCVSENHATQAYLMRRPAGKSNEMSWRSSSAKISSIRTNNYESKFCLTPLHTFPLTH